MRRRVRCGTVARSRGAGALRLSPEVSAVSVAIVAHIHRSALGRILVSPAAGLALATLLWSGNFVIGRALRDAIDPLGLNFWRWLVALLPFTAVALVRQWPLLRRYLLLVVALGLTGLAVPNA